MDSDRDEGSDTKRRSQSTIRFQVKELGKENEASMFFEKVLELDPQHTLAKHKLKQR